MASILVTSRSFSSGSVDVAAQLAAAGHEIVHGAASHELATIGPVLGTATAWIAGTEPITAAHLDAAPGLRVIARYGVGVDSVDLAAAHARGIVVTNTPAANSEAVADHTIALLLALLRRVPAADRAVRSAAGFAFRTHELGALVVGVVGFGAIGRLVVRRLSGFVPRIIVADPFVDPTAIREDGAEPASLDELAERCDVVTLHAPADATLIDATWLDRARDGLLIVNASRAGLVDEHAIVDALRSGRLGGIATDVFAGEIGSEPILLADPEFADRVVLTPHIASHTTEAVDRMSTMAAAEVLAVLDGQRPAHPVPSEVVSP